MADAVKYHGSCSLVGGLAQIDNALSSSTNLKAGTEALASNAFFQEYLTTTSRTFTVTTTVSATPTTLTFASQTSVLSALQYCQDTKVDANKKP
ncbi:MAG: hypothetical protein HC765_13705 [Brachymonas sp.]|nr:hypothetical protein [Brachymonas sp.]